MLNNQFPELIQKLQINRVWFLILGVLLVIGGFFAFAYSFVTTIVAMYFLGGFLIATGFIQLFHSFYSKQNSTVFIISILWSVLYLVVGISLLVIPLESAAYLAILLAWLLIFFGISRLVYGYKLTKMVGSQWIYITGFLDILFGIIILSAWPISGMIFGIIIAVDLLMQGVSFIMIFFSIQKNSFKV